MLNRLGLPDRTGRLSILIVIIATVAIGGSLTGCSLNQEGKEAVSAAWERHQREQSDRPMAYAQVAVVRNDSANPSPSTQPAIELVAQPTLREYIGQALKHNPDILAAEETARAKADRIPQVTALPDPMLSTKTLPEPVRTAEGDNYFNLGLIQKIVVPEKLDRAGRVALEETHMAIAEWERVRLQVIADVKRAYFRIYVIDRAVEITRKNQNLLRTLIDAVRAEVTAGRRQQGDVLRAQVELSNLQAKIIELLQQRTSGVAMLNRLMNRDHDAEVPAASAFEIRQVDATLDTLLATAAKTNPELARFERQIERDREAVELARLAYWPDFTLGFEWMSMEPRDAFEPPRNPQDRQATCRPTDERGRQRQLGHRFRLQHSAVVRKERSGYT